ncbi:hypothetical protein [Nitratifractor sp.]
MNSLTEEIEKFGAKLVREGDDLDFLLLKKRKKEDLKDFLISIGFILFYEDPFKLNFKKYEKTKLIDVDIDLDIDTLFVRQFFYDIYTSDELKQKYFENPQKYKKCVNTIRYILLLRGFNKKYLDFFIKNREFIEKNDYCLEHLNKSPFRRTFKDFDTFLKVMQRKKEIFLYVKSKYLIQYFKVKFFKKRGKVIAFIGIDGSGKSTIIDILRRDFGYKAFYLGDRSVKFSNLYKMKFLKPFSIFIQYFEKLLRVAYIKLSTLRGKHIVTDRYYFEMRKDSLKSKIYDILYNKLFIKPDVVVVLYNSPETILQRKKEASRQEIEAFNNNIDILPFTKVVKIKNDNLDVTLTKILKVLI